MKYLTLTVALAALTIAPAAQAQLFGGLDNNTVLAGAVGAGIGGAIGSNLAPNGQGDEYTAIGGVLGGLAGASYGNSRSHYAGNPYAGRFNPGFNGRNLVGTGVGVALGGAIGSNLAGRGVRQEGTAIGALVGGAAGYALANRGASRYGGNYGGVVPAGPGFGGPGFSGPGFGGSGFTTSGFSGVAQGVGFNPALAAGPSYVPSGQFVSQTYAVQPRFVPQAPDRHTVVVKRGPVQTKYVDRVQRVEVPVEREVVKYVDRVKTVEVPKIIEKPVIQYVDRVQRVEVPVEREVVKYVDRVQRVEVPVEKEVVKYVDRIQTVEVPVEKEVVKYVDRVQRVEVPVDREVVKYVDRYIDRPVTTPDVITEPAPYVNTNPCGDGYVLTTENTCISTTANYSSNTTTYDGNYLDGYSGGYTEHHSPEHSNVTGSTRYGSGTDNIGSAHHEEHHATSDHSSEHHLSSNHHLNYHNSGHHQNNHTTYCYKGSTAQYDNSGQKISGSCSH